MMLYVVRHGIAVDVGEEGVRKDAERFLSAEGRRKTAEVGRGLNTLGIKPDVILTSPLVRARETAELIAAELEGVPPVELCPALAPGGDFMDLVRDLKQTQANEVMWVSHMPEVAEWVSLWIGGEAGIGLAFKRAAVACVGFEGAPAVGAGRLEWLLPPGVSRRIIST